MSPWKSETVAKTLSAVGFLGLLGRFDFAGISDVFSAFDTSLGEGGS